MIAAHLRDRAFLYLKGVTWLLPEGRRDADVDGAFLCAPLTNVLKDGVVTDDTRSRCTSNHPVPSRPQCKGHLMSHLGRQMARLPARAFPASSCRSLLSFLAVRVRVVEDTYEAREVPWSLQGRRVLVLENDRHDKREEEGTIKSCRPLASYEVMSLFLTPLICPSPCTGLRCGTSSLPSCIRSFLRKG